jgi:selenophosphate synthetase-related protein
MKKALTDAGLFSKVVDKDGDRVFVISEIRNRITPIQGDFRTVYHETHFKIALNDKQGKKLWGTSIWIDDTDKPKTMDITQVATSQTGLSMFLASASSLAAKDLVKELQSSLAAGAKAAGK